MLSVSPWCDMAGLGEIRRVMATCAPLVAAPVPVSPGRLVTVMTRYRKLGLSGGLASLIDASGLAARHIETIRPVRLVVGAVLVAAERPC